MAVVHVTKENFETEILNSDKPVLVDFWAAWCGPCKMIAPIIGELADEVDDVKICKINVDEEMELAQKYRIMSIPTLVYLEEGEVKDTMLGAHSKKEILGFIKK
jgi:thioredoxin 1